jgi:hypothetical protein
VFDATPRAPRGDTTLPEIDEGLLQAAGHALDPTDLPLLGMLIHRTSPAEIAATLRIERPELDHRTVVALVGGAQRRESLLTIVLRELSLGPVFFGGVLDEREDAAGHESRLAHRLAGARHLGDLDDAASCRGLDPAARTGGDDLIRARAVVCGDDDLDTIAFHVASLPLGAC